MLGVWWLRCDVEPTSEAPRLLQEATPGLIVTTGVQGLASPSSSRVHLSEGTVEGYLSSAFGRLGVRNRVEAALVGWRAR